MAASITPLGNRIPASHWLQVDLATPRASAAAYIFSPASCRSRDRFRANMPYNRSRWISDILDLGTGMSEISSTPPSDLMQKRRELQARVSTEALACLLGNTRLGAAPSRARLRESRSLNKNCQFSVETILRVNALNCQMAIGSISSLGSTCLGMPIIRIPLPAYYPPSFAQIQPKSATSFSWSDSLLPIQPEYTHLHGLSPCKEKGSAN